MIMNNSNKKKKRHFQKRNVRDNTTMLMFYR